MPVPPRVQGVLPGHLAQQGGGDLAGKQRAGVFVPAPEYTHGTHVPHTCTTNLWLAVLNEDDFPS